MKYRYSKMLKKNISAIGFGTWPLGSETKLAGKQIGWGPVKNNESISAIHKALDLGINFFDTADIYGAGTAEKILGKVLSKERKSVIICTKFGIRELNGKNIRDFSIDWLNHVVENSLRRLRTDYIDILLLHSPPDDFDWYNFDRSGLEKLRESGKIITYGVSSNTVYGAEIVLNAWGNTIIEVIYNIFDRRAEESLIPLVKKLGADFISRVPLGSGFLTGKYTKESVFPITDYRYLIDKKDFDWRCEISNKLDFLGETTIKRACNSLRFCLSNPMVLTAIPGMRTKEQVEQNVRAAQMGSLSDSIINRIHKTVPETYSGWLI